MIALAVAAVITASQNAAPVCADTLTRKTAASSGAPPEHKLGDLPPPKLMRLVLRRVDGCAFAEVRQLSGAWSDVPAGRAWDSPQPAQRPESPPN